MTPSNSHSSDKQPTGFAGSAVQRDLTALLLALPCTYLLLIYFGHPALSGLHSRLLLAVSLAAVGGLLFVGNRWLELRRRIVRSETPRALSEIVLRQLNDAPQDHDGGSTTAAPAAQAHDEDPSATLYVSERRLALALENAELGCWDWHDHDQRLIVDGRYAAMLGYTAEEIHAQPRFWISVLHPEDKPGAVAKLQTHLRGETDLFECEYRLRTKSGSYRWVQVRGRAIERDQQGRPTRLIGVHQDVTERKLAERRMLEQERRFEGLIEGSIQGVFVHRDRMMVFANHTLARMLGYDSPAELLAMESIDEFVAPHERQRLQDINEARLRGDTAPFRYEFEARRKNGTAIVLQYLVSMVDWEGEQAVQVAAIDVTEQKKAEQQLREAKRAAEAANQSKSEFLANMSHEIRTPINGVLGMAELLAATPLEPNQRKYAETISRSGDVLLNLINDILDLSKIGAGKLELHCGPLDLRELTEDVVELVADTAHRKGVELVSTLPAKTLRRLIGDTTRLRQVLTNLVGNAVKFTDSGEVVLRVITLEESSREAQLRFEVSDTGVGISPEAQRNIFKAFAQAEDSTTERFGGTGLGLAICQHLVSLMGGTIGVDSVPGEGSTFWFEIPLAKQTASVDTFGPKPVGIRALVVDDSRVGLDSLLQQLAACHVRPSGADCAGQALDLIASAAAEAQPFDVVFIDRSMPGMDGLALARTLKADPKLGQMPLVLLNSVRDPAVKEPSVQASLTKPVRQAELEQCLISILAVPSPQTEDAAGRSDAAGSEAARTPSAQPAAADQPFSGSRILLVDDNLINQTLAEAMLDNFGCVVTTAGDGRQAVAQVERDSYDLVLMDCQMPEMDGYEATQTIRRGESAAGHRTPIVALTANAMAGDRERCLQAGMDDYLVKPFKQRDLGDMLERWLADRQDASSGAGAAA